MMTYKELHVFSIQDSKSVLEHIWDCSYPKRHCEIFKIKENLNRINLNQFYFKNSCMILLRNGKNAERSHL